MQNETWWYNSIYSKKTVSVNINLVNIILLLILPKTFIFQIAIVEIYSSSRGSNIFDFPIKMLSEPVSKKT